MPGSNYRYSATFDTTYTEDQLLLNTSPFSSTANAHNADNNPNPLQALIEADSKLHLTSLGHGSECSFSCSGSSAGSPRHARSSSVDSLDSNCGGGSSVGSGSFSRTDGTANTEHIPTRLTTKLVCKPAHNPLQFVKINSTLSKEAEEQMKLAKEIKKVKEPLFEEDWQANLDNWKSRRRKSTERTTQRIEDLRWLEEEQSKQTSGSGRKTKTFSEMLEKRGHRSRYNLQLYTNSSDTGNDESKTSSIQKSISDQEMTQKSSSSIITSQGSTKDGDSIRSFNNNADELNNQHHNTEEFTNDSDTSTNRFPSKQFISEEEASNQNKAPHSSSLQPIVPNSGHGCKESDSGLDSLCSSHRTLLTLATDSDFSQDGGSSLDCDMDSGTGNNSHLTTGVELLKEFSSKPSSPAPPARKFAPPHKEFEDGSGLELYLRVSLQPYNDASKDFGFTVTQKDVLIVDTLSPGSASEQAGLRVGDRILAVNGEESVQESDLPLLLQDALETGHLELLVWRHTTTNNLTRQWHRNQSKILIDKATSEENLLKIKKNKNKSSLVSKHKSTFEAVAAQPKEEAKTPDPPLRDAKFHEKVKSFERLSIHEEEAAAIRKPSLTKKPPQIPHKPKIQQLSHSSGQVFRSQSLENGLANIDSSSEPANQVSTPSSPLKQEAAQEPPFHSPPNASNELDQSVVTLTPEEKISSPQKEENKDVGSHSNGEISLDSPKQPSPINTSGLNIIYQSPPPLPKPDKDKEKADSSVPAGPVPCSTTMEDQDLYNMQVVLDSTSYEEDVSTPPSSIDPPKEKPPPPPPCADESPPPSPPKDNILSTKKIKKELRRRRTDFLGIESTEEFHGGNGSMKPPPTMEEILMKERDSLREMSRQLAASDKDLSSQDHWNSSYSKDVEDRLKESDQKIRSLQAERRRVQGERLRGQSANWDPLHPTNLPNNEVGGEEDYGRLHDELSLWQREEHLRMQEESLRRERENLYREQEALRREREHYQQQMNQFSPHHSIANVVGYVGQKPAPPTMPVRPTAPEKPERLKQGAPPIRHPKPVPQRVVKPTARPSNSNPWPTQRPPLPIIDRGANASTYQIPKKRNSLESMESSKYNQNHWLIQEAEMRRIAELKEQKCPDKRQGVAPPESQHNLLSPSYPLTQAKSLPSDLNKPGHELSQKTSPAPTSPPKSTDKKLSVSGRKRCSNCDKELGKGAAMIIQSLELYYHVACFQCSVCRTQLGNGDRGTDVRVRNGKIHCQACFSNDEGLQFTQV